MCGCGTSTPRRAIAWTPAWTSWASGRPYPLVEEHSTSDESYPGFYRVTKLRYGGTSCSRDLSTIVYSANVTLLGIPDEAHQYMLGSRSALD